VLSSSTTTADPGTQSEKKGPMMYVNSANVGEEKASLREGRDGLVPKG